MKKYYFVFSLIILTISTIKSQNKILSTAFNKIKFFNSYNIKYYSKNNFSIDTNVKDATPFIKHIPINNDIYKTLKIKYFFYEPANSKKWFDFTIMNGNKWYIADFIENKILNIDTLDLTLKNENYNYYEDFISNFEQYSILFYPNKYYNIFKNWNYISDEKIDNNETWLFEYNFKIDNSIKVNYKININQSDTFLKRFTVNCFEYEKLHELIDVYTQLNINSYKSLDNNYDSIFDLNYQINNFKNNNNLEKKKEIQIKNIINTGKDTAKILINSNFITMNGDSIKLSSIKGKWILVDFWYVGCYPCYKAMDFFNKINQKYKNSNLVIYGINPIDNDRKALSRLFNDKGLTYQYLIDPKGKCRYNVGLSGFPQLFLISPDQKIVWQHFGYTTDMDAELEKIIEEKISNK